MNWLDRDGVGLCWREDGDPAGRPVLFLNSLGTDMRLWDGVLGHLPGGGLRLIRMDTRGHGLSDVPPGPYALDTLVGDAAALIDQLELSGLTMVGISLGGMMAQALAHARADRVSALVLSNTAARMGTPELWQARIDAVTTGGMPSLADGVLERWFGPTYRARQPLGPWRNLLLGTPASAAQQAA